MTLARTPTMKPWVALAGLCALVTARSAAADDKATCLDAAGKGQSLSDAHKLVEARDQFRACASAQCPAVVQHDCASWLDQTQTKIPTVVPMAKDEAGNGLPGVKVSMDGKFLFATGDGRPVEVDPGTHAFAFEDADGRRGGKTIVVGEGERDVRVVVTLGGPPSASAQGTPSGEPLAGARPTTSSGSSTAPSTFPWKTTGLVTGGVGVVGIAIGAALGIDAIGKKNDAGCASDGMCRDAPAVSTQKDAQNAGNLATVFFVAGGVLAAAGVTMFFLAPSSPVQVAPTAGKSSAGFQVRGTW